jgi:RNA polymerase sigma-70 factor, ECF subfamily
MDNGSRFLQVVGPIEDRMIATIWRVLRHPQDAEDALQTAVATIWKDWGRIERHPNAHALILKICATAALDECRRRQRRRERADVAALTNSLSAPRSDPSNEAIAREALDDVMEAIARLPANQATAIVMRCVQSESYEVIAQAVGCGTATARKHVARGRERLARSLRHLDFARLVHNRDV